MSSISGNDTATINTSQMEVEEEILEEEGGRHMNDSTLPPETLSRIEATMISTHPNSNNGNSTTTTTSSSSMPSPDQGRRMAQQPRYNNKKITNKASRIQKGFGLADWTRLCKTAKDLAQRHGQELRNKITREEVATHCTEYDAWIVIHNKVYNIGPYLPYHPGGMAILKSSLGKDASALFDKYHRWVNVDGLIGPLLLGYLDLTPRSTTMDDGGTYLPHSTTSTLTTDDGFAMPAPRHPVGRRLVPPSLLAKNDTDDDCDDEFLVYDSF